MSNVTMLMICPYRIKAVGGNFTSSKGITTTSCMKPIIPIISYMAELNTMLKMNYRTSTIFPVVLIVPAIASVATTLVDPSSDCRGILTLRTNGDLKIGFPSSVRI